MFIQFITTGGTIDKIYHDANSEFEVGDPQVIDILDEARVAFEYEVVPLFRKDSLEMDDEDRARVREAVHASSASRIIVTHGTDTMSETATFLEPAPDKVVVLTGSLSPARFKVSDAEFNLGMAIAAVQSLDPGVYITMNGMVFEADNVKKNREAKRFERIRDVEL